MNIHDTCDDLPSELIESIFAANFAVVMAARAPVVKPPVVADEQPTLTRRQLKRRSAQRRKAERETSNDVG